MVVVQNLFEPLYFRRKAAVTSLKVSLKTWLMCMVAFYWKGPAFAANIRYACWETSCADVLL